MEDLLELETTEETEQPEGAEETAETEETPADGEKTGEETEEGEKPPVTSLFQADGRKLDPQVLTALNKFKADNPEIGKLISKSLYRVAELDREFPGGITELREMRDKVEELGGVAGIEQKLEGAAELDTLAQQFMSADPAFVEDMAQSSPEAFAALAPAVFAKFAEVNADGFAGYIGRVVYSDMQKAGLPLMMQRLADFIPGDNPKAKEAYEAINGYLGRFVTMAEKPLPSAKASTTAPKQDDTAKREDSLRAREWEADRSSVQRRIVNAEYTRCLAGRKPNGEEKAQILELFTTRTAKAADRMFPGWQEKSQRYIRSNDKQGYLRYMESIYKRVAPEAMLTAVNGTLKGARTRTGATTTTKPKAQTSTATAAADATYKPVGKEPGTWDIDFGRTTQAMLRENRAVLKDGRKVSWR